MLYDGAAAQKKWNDLGRFISWARPTPVYPDLDPPCIWFPYGRMGKTASEPIWDTTGGKFGPFAGQCFVGDQTNVERHARRAGEGERRLPGGVLPVPQRASSAASTGSASRPTAACSSARPIAAGARSAASRTACSASSTPARCRSRFTTSTLTKTGFDLTFTKPIDPKSLGAKPASVASFTYVYFSNYGCPEMDSRFESVGRVKLSTRRDDTLGAGRPV